MGSLVEFVLGRDARGKEPEQMEQRRGRQKQRGGEVGRLQDAQPGDRGSSPQLCWKNLGNTTTESSSHDMSQDT